jgi:hypothetical protein
MSERAVPDNHATLGHQSEVDYTQIASLMSQTPEQRLDKHEGRLFAKEALTSARLRQRNDRPTGNAPDWFRNWCL